MGAKVNKKKIIFLVLITIVLFFALPVLYKFFIGEQITHQLKKQLYTLNIKNSWHADKLVICRGYLHTSKELELDLNKSNLEDEVAEYIANSSRWTEGIHLYFVKNKMFYMFIATQFIWKI